MHALMRVMWSGKWAVVTPHAVLNAVWELTPCFRGYTQHDAQEFLWYVLYDVIIIYRLVVPMIGTDNIHYSELLLVLQTELEVWPVIPLYPGASLPHPLYPHQLLPSLFQGQLLSKVYILR